MSTHLATRGSALARWQADQTAAVLRDLDPATDYAPLIVRSSGDRDQTTALARFGRIGIFTVEVDRAVAEGRAAIGVHSLKDMTTLLPDGVRLAGVLPRGPVEDVLVGAELSELGTGSRVGTGSMRRRAMLARRCPGVTAVEMRGNVGTRIEKLAAGEADALLMARAGLVRLGLERHIREILDPEVFIPAVGQGIVGLTCAEADLGTWEKLAPLREGDSWFAALAERAFLAGLRGGCNVPVGGHARVHDGQITLSGIVLSPDGAAVRQASRTAAREAARELGAGLAEELLEQGAQELLDQARPKP